MIYQEYELQKSIAKYISLQYPDIDFISDTVAFSRLTKSQANRISAIQKKDFKCPDLIIFEPRNGFSGLFIELKKESPFKKNGELYKSEHLEKQQEAINRLIKKGYQACFSWGFEMTKEIIDNYLK